MNVKINSQIACAHVEFVRVSAEIIFQWCKWKKKKKSKRFTENWGLHAAAPSHGGDEMLFTTCQRSDKRRVKEEYLPSRPFEFGKSPSLRWKSNIYARLKTKCSYFPPTLSFCNTPGLILTSRNWKKSSLNKWNLVRCGWNTSSWWCHGFHRNFSCKTKEFNYLFESKLTI